MAEIDNTTTYPPKATPAGADTLIGSDSAAAGATTQFPASGLLARANHTGTQVAATISDLGAATDARLAGYATKAIPVAADKLLGTDSADSSQKNFALAALKPLFGQLPYLSLPDGWDTAWKAAKAASGSTPARILNLGDSTTQGTAAAADILATPWAMRLRAALANTPATSALGGDFYAMQYDQAYWTANGKGTIGGTAPISSLATARTYSPMPFGRLAFWTGAQAGTVATFVTPYACTDVDIITMDYNAGTFDYTVDGGAPVTVTVPSGGSTNPLRRTPITGLASGVHTVTVQNGSGTACPVVVGFACYKSRTTGIQMAHAAVTGATARGFWNGGLPATEQSRLYQGYTTTAANNIGGGFPAQPHLAIGALAINDCQGGGYGPLGFQRGLERAGAFIRRGNPGAALLLIAMPMPDPALTDATLGGNFANAQDWPVYIEAMYAAARTLNAAVYNAHVQFGQTPVADGLTVAAGDSHPSALGHQLIAATVGAIL